MDKGKLRVYVGMSGGVDSSVTAALLKQQGYQVTGVYMKNWTQDLPGLVCPWADDLADAKRVAVQLDIPFKVFDFQKEYKQLVVAYMIAEYKAGRTPNPDIMCNQEIKFDLFLRAALADGADMIATGHYARVARVDSEQPHNRWRVASGGAAPAFSRSSTLRGQKEGADRTTTLHPSARLGLPRAILRLATARETFTIASASSPITSQVRSSRHVFQGPQRLEKQWLRSVPEKVIGERRTKEQDDSTSNAALLTGLDKHKDQSYFLYRVTSEALGKTLLPIGELTKPQVREEARKLGLATAEKKDSQGICFVGKIGIKEFLQNYVEAAPGDIIDKKTGHVIGQHDGAIFYTIGQRHGLRVGGGLPFYVVDKNMEKNEIYVTTDLNDEHLWRKDLELSQLHWINNTPKTDKIYYIRTRYRAPLIACRIESLGDERLELVLQDPERAITAGQSAVLYEDDRVVGGGIVV